MNSRKIAATLAGLLALMCILAWVDASNEKHADRVVDVLLDQCGDDASDRPGDFSEDGGDVDTADNEVANDRDDYADVPDDDDSTNADDRRTDDRNDANPDDNDGVDNPDNQTDDGDDANPDDNDGVDNPDNQTDDGDDADVDDGNSDNGGSNNKRKALVEKISLNTHLPHGQRGFCPTRDSRGAGMGVALACTGEPTSAYVHEWGGEEPRTLAGVFI